MLGNVGNEYVRRRLFGVDERFDVVAERVGIFNWYDNIVLYVVVFL